MLGNTYDTQVCSIARALELVGERWTLLILRNALFAGSTRYRDFQGDLENATCQLASEPAVSDLYEAQRQARQD